MISDDQITMEFLDRQRTALRASPLPRARRDELLRLNAFTRALLEAAGAKSLAEVVELIPGLASKKGPPFS